MTSPNNASYDSEDIGNLFYTSIKKVLKAPITSTHENDIKCINLCNTYYIDFFRSLVFSEKDVELFHNIADMKLIPIFIKSFCDLLNGKDNMYRLIFKYADEIYAILEEIKKYADRYEMKTRPLNNKKQSFKIALANIMVQVIDDLNDMILTFLSDHFIYATFETAKFRSTFYFAHLQNYKNNIVNKFFQIMKFDYDSNNLLTKTALFKISFESKLTMLQLQINTKHAVAMQYYNELTVINEDVERQLFEYIIDTKSVKYTTYTCTNRTIISGKKIDTTHYCKKCCREFCSVNCIKSRLL